MPLVSVWREVGDRVFVRRYAFFDTNILAIVVEDGFVVADTRTSHRQAQEILRELLELGSGPVRAVVDSHHHYDHAFGNHAFRPSPIWGQARCASRLVGDGEARREQAMHELPEVADELAEVVIDPPDRTFAERQTLELGRTIELRHLGRGHTDNDVVVEVPDARVVFAGDLLEDGAPPFFADSYPLDWPDTVEALLPFCDGAVVPGHGNVRDRSFAAGQLEEFRTVAALAREVERGSLSLAEAVSRGPYAGQTGTTAIERGVRQLRGELD